MSGQRIEVLGVYSLSVTDELVREQMEILYGDEMSATERVQAERRCREQLDSTVLVEAAVRHRDTRFSASDFTQPIEGVPEAEWQAAWAEAWLSADGEALQVDRWRDPPETGDLRVAFFLHFWDPGKPLRTSYGDVTCPPVEPMPERLARLVPYEPVD